ncbi:uncharacterized protein LOC127862448 isoform X2 [Dreissena polymorpha]|uniref:uncharacterized protein LOC127862448 isoform X2 n=1 Tax=Dreissena polymorpha TaxID=45954 RepID=UPI002263B869|nr:uncharacterized protein LOC127862448 isoform X2 [Dreissena polymorpha]
MRLLKSMASDGYPNSSLTLQISVSDDCRRRVVQTSQAGGDTRVVRTKPGGDLRDVLNERRARTGSSMGEATIRSKIGCCVGQTGDLRQSLNTMRAQSKSQSTNIRFLKLASYYQLRLQLGGVLLGNGSSILSYLPSLVPASALSRDVMATTASKRFSGDVSKEETAVGHSRIGRKRHSSALSDDGALEVAVDTADEPPAKRARSQKRPRVSVRACGIQTDPFHWRSYPYVWQREDYRCEQRKSTTWGLDPYTWRKDQTRVRPATCYTWKRPDP